MRKETTRKKMQKHELARCDSMLCHNSGGHHEFVERDDWATEINIIPMDNCPNCGTILSNIEFTCMRTNVVIAGEQILFCLVRSRCTKCTHVDWFRPSPEIICQSCNYTVRFSLPSSSWAMPWECNRWS